MEMKNLTVHDNSILNLIKLLIILLPFALYKYVDYYRANQEAWIKLFLILLIFLAIINLYKKQYMIWRKSDLDIPLFLFLSLMTLSVFSSNFKAVSFNDFITFFFYIFLFFVVVNYINKKKDIFNFLRLFLITSFLIALYVILHYYGVIPLLKEYGEVTSTIGQKNWTSNYLGLFFPLHFFLFFIENNKKKKLFYYLSLSTIYIAIMICQSRGAWISLFLIFNMGYLIFYKYKIINIFKKNKKWTYIVILTFLLITIIYSTDNILNKSKYTAPERIFSTFEQQAKSLNSRILLCKSAFKMIQDKPIFYK